MNRTPLAIILVATGCLFTACGGSHQATDSPVSTAPTVTGGSQTPHPSASEVPVATNQSGTTEVQPLTIDLQANPNVQFRVDSFSVPAASRAEFEATLHQNAGFLARLPGFKGHVVFEKTSGPTTFNIVTIAAWESSESMKNAGEKVRADYQRTGFDMQGTIARWGVTASIGGYRAPLPQRDAGVAGTALPPLNIDLQANPDLQVNVGSFSVPTASRAEFEATMHKNAGFLAKLPGFKGHMLLEKTSGPTTFNVVTIAAWESPEAMKSAGEKVRADYQRTGFDMQGTIARWGVTASIGDYRAPMALQ